ncbi:MAG: ABC transporter substrate-binding protein [Firmicutes bacterium]|nr:ABC transporter substrate-binding protein [Bacillota bacterium]
MRENSVLKGKNGAAARVHRRVKGGLRFGVLVLCCLALAGCGGGNAENDGSAGSAGKEEKADHDLAKEPWTEAGEIEDSAENWTLMEYREDLTPQTPDREMVRLKDRNASDGTDYYILEEYLKMGQTEGAVRKYYLTCVDMETMESRREELLLTGEGQEEFSGLAEDIRSGQAYIAGMDAHAGKVCLLVAQLSKENGDPVHCYAVRLDGEWKPESGVDLLPGLEKAGMCSEGIVPEGILQDGEGRFYVGTEEYGVFDGTGVLLKKLEAAGEKGSMLHQTCRLPDGRPVFESVNAEDRQTTLFCMEGSEEKVLYRGTCSYAETRYINEKGEILYFGKGGLLRWDAVTGKCQLLYQDSALDPLSCRAIAETQEDTLTVAFYDNEETFLLKLQLDGKPEEKVLTVYQLFEDDTLTKRADEYCRKHPGVRIDVVTVQEEGDDSEMALTRLVTRLTAGEKPELFWLSSEQLKALQDKGALADLQEILPEELLEQIFPGVLQAGTVDHKLCGIANEAYIETVVVSEESWPGETWSFRDVMALAEGQAAAGGITGVFGGETWELMLFDLVLRDITAGNSTLADREKKECRFDSEEFIRALEFCKKYGLASEDRDKMTFEEIMEGMHNGSILAYRLAGDLKEFSRVMAELGDGFHCVGFPTEGSYGGCVSCYSFIAMNAEGEDQETAADFMQYLLSERVQRSMGICTVRRDVLTGNVIDGNGEAQGFGTYPYPVFQNKDREVIPLEGKPDGSSFLPEYLEILEQADYMSNTMDDLGMMILEEAGGFLNGDRSAEEVAGIIQSKAWVYLNE